MNSSPTAPLTATSPSGNLIALANTSSKSSLIRCYDSTSSSLKFTLRIPNNRQGNIDQETYELQKLVFASDQFLVGQTVKDNNTVLVWDIHRGINSQIIHVDDKETLSDVAVQSSKLYALTYHAHNDKFKTRVMQYDCHSGKLEKKIKVGSVKTFNALGLAIHDEIMAIGMGNMIKLCDLNGGKLDKVDDVSTGNDGCVIKYSADGAYLVASGEGSAILFRVSKENKIKLQPVAVLKLSDGAVSNIDILIASKSVRVMTHQYGVESSYFVISSDLKPSKLDGMVPTLPIATMQTKIDTALISSGFHPIRSDEILFVFRHASNAPGSGTTLPIKSLTIDDDVSGSIVLSPPSDDAEGKNKKRRAEAMAPGETGMEASMTADLTALKKLKGSAVEAVDEDGNDITATAEDEDDFDLEDEEDDGQGGQSIADRLAMLSAAMEQETDEEEDFDEDEDDAGDKRVKVQETKSKFSNKTATSESLTTLLTQALSSNDLIRLNIALQVTEPHLISNTVKSLQLLDAQRPDPNNTEGYVAMLMGHIVRRMARRHTLVTSLMCWIKAILLASSQISSRRMVDGASDEEEERLAREGRELASKLGPLRNFLNERVECFPQLLRLEGRLALLGQQL